MRCCRPLVAMLVALVLVWSAVPAGAASPSPDGWSAPVAGPLLRPFSEPRTWFGPGHRGVDFVAAPGTPVRAAGDGVVTFAGRVAGALHVVVGHAGDLRTSYSFLASVAVRRGQRVARGDVVGTSGGSGEAHAGDGLHFGLRQGDAYIDPMVLFRPVDLTAVVHLAPVSDPLFRTEADERRGLLGSIGGFVGGLAGTARDAIGSFAGVGRSALDALAEAARPLADLLVDLGEKALDAFVELATMNPWVRRALLVLATVRGIVGYVREQMRCDHHAPPADGTGGSGHRAMFVAGINTDVTRPGGPSMDIHPGDLGYADDEVTWFSYSGRAVYDETDALAPVMASAQRLADQLKAMERAEPGREVDLIAHSQGGVVVLAFLELIYDPGDPAYPPLGTFVTFASPLDGAPLATVAGQLREGYAGWALAELVDWKLGLDLSDADATRDLADGSDLMEQLAAADRPGVVDLTTIGGTSDWVVPGDAATTDGARHTVVGGIGLDTHSDLLTDADALRAARSALEARDALPCRDLVTFIEGELFPPLIEEYTYGFGSLWGQLEGPTRALPGP